jgi:RNA polymerase sigma factor (sigma-70 family)
MSGTVFEHSVVNSLFCEHRNCLLRYLLQRVRCPDTAEDLSQEAYLRLLRQERIPRAGNLTAYLFKTAERLAIDFLRYDQRVAARLAVLDETLECPHVQPEELAILRQQCELLLQAIAALPEQCRHVFLLRKIDELSYGEIAQQLGISEKTVQRYLVKAILHCHRRLGLVFLG